MNKQYIGDGVYVQPDTFDGVILTTSDGVKVTNVVYMERAVVEAFLQYVKELYSK